MAGVSPEDASVPDRPRRRCFAEGRVLDTAARCAREATGRMEPAATALWAAAPQEGRARATPWVVAAPPPPEAVTSGLRVAGCPLTGGRGRAERRTTCMTGREDQVRRHCVLHVGSHLQASTSWELRGRPLAAPAFLQERSDEWMMARADKLKEGVHMLFNTCDNTAAMISLLDTIQHLGIDHHFEQDINGALSKILESDFSNSSSLHEVALAFRLLREHGHWVSPDVFNKFKGEDGNFNKDISNEPRGLLSLYNAAHLLIHDEPTLEEAKAFARHHLDLISGSLGFPLDKQVKRALQVPLPRTCKRIETLHYISEYSEEEVHNPVLLELARLDFNLLQHVHLKELKAITEWWNNFSGKVALSFIRSRIVESYTWAYVVYYEKGFKLPRSIIAKMIVIITTLDDTYDTHATIEECRKLHEAIQRWDESAVSILPEYLKNLYMEVLKTFKDIEAEVPINMNYDISYLRKSIQNHVTGYLQEAEWSHKNYTPSFKEQVDLTSLTIGAPTLSVSVMAGMSDEIMEQSLEWAASVPDVVVSAGKIVRFMNDIGAFKRRKCKGDAASSVECYMHEHGVSGEVAVSRIDALIEHEWKTLNQARFANRALLPALERIIGLAYTASFFYSNRNDVYTKSTLLQGTIESFFVKPI